MLMTWGGLLGLPHEETATQLMHDIFGREKPGPEHGHPGHPRLGVSWSVGPHAQDQFGILAHLFNLF